MDFANEQAGFWAKNDEKVQLLLDFVLPHLHSARESSLVEQAQRDAIAAGVDTFSHHPLLVGLSGLQGIGKSTITALLAEGLQQHGFMTKVISIDDFYKTFEERQELQAQHPANALLKTRGQPGTHDLALATAWIKQFKGSDGESAYGVADSGLLWPSFDKSAGNGRGDRAYTHVPGCKSRHLACVILEGWCVGFQALDWREIEERHCTAILQNRGRLAVFPPLNHIQTLTRT